MPIADGGGALGPVETCGPDAPGGAQSVRSDSGWLKWRGASVNQLVLFNPPTWDTPGYEDPDRLSDAVAARYFTMAGRCSGIPECCIEAFITAPRVPALAQSAHPPAPGLRAGYRQCATCAATGNIVTIRHCPGERCSCGIAKEMLFTVPRSARIAWLEMVEPRLIERAKRATR